MNSSVAASNIKTDPIVDCGTVASVQDLSVTFQRGDGTQFSVVRNLDLTLATGEVVGVVGESGSGKSMTARSMMGLMPHGCVLSGEIRVAGQDVMAMSRAKLRTLRGKGVAMVFQDPMTSFNPVRRIGDQIIEAIAVHHRLPRAALVERAIEALSRVGIVNAADRMRAYPHEFSGGMRQRALIAMSIVNNPDLLIADEPTTALDVTVQDQILNVLRSLNEHSGTAIMLITHNIALVASICSRMVVMYAGCIVEDGPVGSVLTNPQHPYTWMLLRSVPRIDSKVERLVAIQGQPPDPADLPSGCKFHPRCPFAIDRCRVEEPELRTVGDRRSARCFLLMDNISERERARV